MLARALCALGIVWSSVAIAETYECPARTKVDSDRTYSADQIKKGQFSTRVEELPEGTFLSRCSFALSDGKVTCDRYKVDRVEHDRRVSIKKYYVFRAQFDFQIFSNLTSLENNGRGSIQFGQCRLVSP